MGSEMCIRDSAMVGRDGAGVNNSGVHVLFDASRDRPQLRRRDERVEVDVLVDSHLAGRDGPGRRYARQEDARQVLLSRPVTVEYRFSDVFDPKPLGSSLAIRAVYASCSLAAEG